MSTTVNILCYKSKTLANGESPLMIRICKDGKKKYKSIGVSISPKYWDFKKGKLKRNCPNHDSIQSIITERIKQYSTQVIEFQTTQKEFTASSLIECLNKPLRRKTVKTFLENEIQRLKTENRFNYASSHKHLLNSLNSFKSNLDIPFSDIDITWLKGYESFLRQKGLANNSIGIRFRTLRAIYNRAIEENIVKSENYPFKRYKVSKLKEETIKRAISKEDIGKIMAYKSTNPYLKLAIDLFIFSYFMGGINFIDIAYLTNANIIDGQLIYVRKKTKGMIKLPLQSIAFELINKYKNADSPYLFPILSSFHSTEQQKINRVRKVVKKVNAKLREVGEELNLPIKLTSYVSRHSQATNLKRSGVPTAIISQIMGHSSEKVTQIYLDSFENSQIDEAMKNLL
ncbi:site-specific recombinase XerD [Parabacteroides sp. PF5-5]|uniref:site-specific integrase n=1 Tax=unclassified Parabacteroides TaxID=2649774 RepID=UPI002475356F|nr:MULTISPECIES: site-specific integrase [unclassified Parabacteroides]MDH6305921.1 site-specific recombinase XerD [Parabacteroides sp. PH5-39]MDH6316864.1 site-specific recombinase XerD [Parabacteroides sp. PF5-13]MDH6320633.1 site-specific recombinase XerD [Parabacteroides sp. PH5-13]MDH6324446.1 site-specific recombinase XerD [Parabacteroides sp. PH5-8]MDH6328049.1 site-specific recombinase XerD [Parabacteroides sp. PH5-41]